MANYGADVLSQYDEINPQLRGAPAGLPPLGAPEPVPFPAPVAAPPRVASMTPPDPNAAFTHAPGYMGEPLPDPRRAANQEPSPSPGVPPQPGGASSSPFSMPATPQPMGASPLAAPAQDPNKLVTTGTSTTVTSGKLSKEQRGVIDERKGITADQIAASDKQREYEVKQAEVHAQVAGDLYNIETEHEKKQQQIIEQENKRIQAAREQVDKAVEERKAAKLTSFFDKQGGEKFQMLAAIALGGLGAAFSARGGGSSENKVMTTMMQLADRDMELQKQKIANLDANVAMARTGVTDAEGAKAQMLTDAYANKAAAMGKTARLLEKQLAQTGMDAAAIAADQRVVAFKTAQNDFLQKAYEPLTQHIQSTTQRERQGAQQQAATAYLEKAQTLIKDDTDYKQFGESMKKARGAQEMEAGLQQALKEQNPTATNAFIRLVAQQINGGVLSDGEGKQLIEQAGGVWDSANNKIAKLSTGTVSPETAQKFIGTIRNVRTNAAQTASAAREGLMSRYGQVVPVGALNILVPEIPGQVAGKQIQVRNKQTGETQTVLQMPDGSIRPLGA